MKKRFYALMLVVAMVAMTLVGCGSDTTDTTNTTNDVTVNTEVEESGEVVEPEVEVDVPETEVPEVETTEEPTTEEDDFYSDSYQWAFPEGMEGFTDKFVLASDETMSFNCTHYVDINGNEMNFSWVGPTELGEQAWSGTSTLVLANASRTYLTYAWSSILDDMNGAIKHYDKETIVTVNSNTIYNDGDFYELYDEATYDKVIFKVTRIVEDVEYIGYAVYMDDYETMTTYQFNYLERSDIFDNERALSVANSIDFWTYNPGEIVTE